MKINTFRLPPFGVRLSFVAGRNTQATKTKTKTMDDAGKAAVVTGATSGLGRAAAQALAKQAYGLEGKLRKAPRQAEDPAFAASLRSTLQGLVS